jgi:hypothetical protein
MRRIVGKGAPIQVTPGKYPIVHDVRNDALDRLVHVFDSRGNRGGVNASATGTVFECVSRRKNGNRVLLPHYNGSLEKASEYGEVFKAFDVDLEADGILNFIWVPYDLGAFYTRHLFF